jgi:type IV pilus assembly protein PilA
MKINNKDGFTIIEVVLVLAIAGLIFLMVFVALPALQMSQRDTARKNDVSLVAAGVTTYTGNNRGAFPTSATLATYVSEKSDNTTSITVSTTTGAQTISPDDGVVVVTQKAQCGASTGGDSASQVLIAGSTRQFTVTTKLESGNGAYFCQNN